MNRKHLVTIMAHIVGWLLCFSFVIAFVVSGQQNAAVTQVVFSWQFVVFAFILFAIFYLNLYFLLPAFFITKKYFFYTLSIIFLLLLVFYVKPFENLLHSQSHSPQTAPPPTLPGRFAGMPPGQRQPQKMNFDIVSLILFLTAWSVSAIIVISRQWRLTERNKAFIEMEKASAQLSFLKAQISPHFLFNTLNNIYALAITKNEQTASSILRLSNMMRYITDDAKEDFVTLEKELACINNYIELQKLRLGKNIQFVYELTGFYDNIKIAPLVLMPFIENVFKHGISNKQPSQIFIKLHANDGIIHLYTSNTINKNNNKPQRTGVGMENVKRRLEHLYAQKYKLEVSQTAGVYIVNLFLTDK